MRKQTDYGTAGEFSCRGGAVEGHTHRAARGDLQRADGPLRGMDGRCDLHLDRCLRDREWSARRACERGIRAVLGGSTVTYSLMVMVVVTAAIVLPLPDAPLRRRQECSAPGTLALACPFAVRGSRASSSENGRRWIWPRLRRL